MIPFAPLAIDLAGRNLIEASAGTGKTYAISSLYVRLVVEAGLLPEHILVVTFTEAATKELRERIRSRLRAARESLNSPIDDDEFLSQLLQSAKSNQAAGELVRQRLDVALQTFDCAAIATIHGFCNRALQEHAFESGSLYETELSALQAPVVREVVDDFWRLHFFGNDTDLLDLAESANWSPESFTVFLRGKLGNRELQLLPQFSAADIAADDALSREIYGNLQRLWLAQGEHIRSLLTDHPGLRRSAETFRPDILAAMLEEMDAYLAVGRPYRLFDRFDRFSAGFLARERLKKHDPPSHEFFTLCDRLVTVVARRKLAVFWSLYVYVNESLPTRKSRANIRFYDDLLIDLHAALTGESGPLLAGRIRERFRAALIDEFQDTDQLQYRIFRSIFNDDAIPLFLIGDPKQAIYAFRGADIFAYLQAKQDTPPTRRFTMDKNWRSAPELVDAVSLLFSRQPQPLFFADLDFPPVTAAGVKEPFCAGARDPAPLQLWFMGRAAGNGKPLELVGSRQKIVASVVDEIAALLADTAKGRATIAGRAVTPGDMAIIVRTHGEAALCRDALTRRGIPAIVRSNASVFTAPEAADLRLLLAAIAEPARGERLRTALTTQLLGRTGNEIAALHADEEATAWQQWLTVFREYHDLWQTQGVMAMFRRLLAREQVRGRLLALPGGERRLTNLLHCGELLHAEESASRLGIEALYTWFSNQISSPPEGEEHQIRLESDEQAVRILTIHISKGLEFPIVFAPFSWGGVPGSEQTVLCHDAGRLVADFGSDEYDRHRQQADRESLAENLRLLYVALTRARYRCYLVWGRFKNSETSALAYLLHGPAGDGTDVIGHLRQQLAEIDDDALLQPLRQMTASGSGLLTVTVNPAVTAAASSAVVSALPSLRCRSSERAIADSWKVASFTSFVSGHGETAELPDHDALGSERPAADEAPPEGSIFAFPRGAKAGTFLHGIFERLDFAAANAAAISQVVSTALERSSYSLGWRETLGKMVQQVVQLPLPGRGGAFALASLERGSWRSELEFFFPLRFLDSPRLAELLQRHAAASQAELAKLAAMLDFRAVEGMVHGFVDLVFSHAGRYYLLDWKSNHLGNRSDNYGGEQLRAAMTANRYPLQYLLYTVALNRYLQSRDPAYRYESGFGGVFYIFLRGVDADHPDCGVFYDLPSAALVEELTTLLLASEGG